MPLTLTAANDALEWVDAATWVALLSSIGQYGGTVEVTGAPYARQAVSFGPMLAGVRQALSLHQFSVPAFTTVSWYALLDASLVTLAVMPHCTSVATNQPQTCFFIDTTTGWIDAPDHTLTVGTKLIFLSGQSLYANTYPAAVYDPISGGNQLTNITYNTLSYSIWAQGPFWIWPVVEVAAHRFRIAFYEGAGNVYVPAYPGWGYYQRIEQTYFSGGGTVTIGALRIAGYG